MKFLSLRHTKQQLVLGINRRNLELVLRKNPRKFYPLADDKLKTKSILESKAVPTVPTLTTFSSFFELGKINRRLDGYSEFVIKPARGRAGRGIHVITNVDNGRFMTASGREKGIHEIKRHLADIIFGVYSFDTDDRAIVEQRIHPAPFFAQLKKDALSDMRFVVVDGKAVSCMIRVPTSLSAGRANLHKGAIGLGVDLESGRVFHAWLRGKSIVSHPDTGALLIGSKVPAFKDITCVAEAAGAVLPLGYLGVDMVVDADIGPMVMEVNVRPGLEIQNVTESGLRGKLTDAGVLE